VINISRFVVLILCSRTIAWIVKFLKVHAAANPLHQDFDSNSLGLKSFYGMCDGAYRYGPCRQKSRISTKSFETGNKEQIVNFSITYCKTIVN
jgi:hypothetical protein